MTDERPEPAGEPGFRIEPEYEPIVDPTAPPVRGHALVPRPDLAAALARADRTEALLYESHRQGGEHLARAQAAEARVRELESAYQAASSLLRASATRANAAEARVREWADEYAFERDLASQRGSRITVLEAKVWALIAAGDNLSRWAHHGPACWVTIGGPGDGRCTCGVSEHASAWKKAKEGQA